MTERKKLVKKLDEVFSLYIRQRDKKCVLCGTTENLQAGHVITRTKYSVRWDENNVFCQCRACNYRHEYNPEIFIMWYIQKYGNAAMQNLIRKSNNLVKYKNSDLKEMICYYREKLKK